MAYSFDILGISPLLHFFNQQHSQQRQCVEYVGTRKCTLDAFIQSVEAVSPKRGWDVDDVVETVINFWVNNSDKISYWRERLKDAGKENLLVARVGDIEALRATFDALFNND